jgi:hypothetical protein
MKVFAICCQPAPCSIQIPSPQFQAATLTNLTANGNAPRFRSISRPSRYITVGSRCRRNAGHGRQWRLWKLHGSALLGSAPCAYQFRNTPTSLNHEYLWSARVDHMWFSDKDRGYVRVFRDNGFQPTYTSPFGPTFNVSSTQPQMAGQVSETHTFGPNAVNQFSGSVLYYAAIFNPSDPSGALAALPTFMSISPTAFLAGGRPGGDPQFCTFRTGGACFNISLLDDFSDYHGKHTFRVGFSWLHQTVSDLDFESLAGLIAWAWSTRI